MQQRPPRQRLSSNALLLTNPINSRLVGKPDFKRVPSGLPVVHPDPPVHDAGIQPGMDLEGF
jgi:hypothetical protein